MKKYLLILVLAMALIFTACGGNKTENTTVVKEESQTEQVVEEKAEENTEEAELKEFTLEELKEFDGKEGRDAYVAVDGIVYDVTNVGGWKNGEHNGVKAGTDGTVELKEKSPHGVSKLTDLPIVGKIVE